MFAHAHGFGTLGDVYDEELLALARAVGAVEVAARPSISADRLFFFADNDAAMGRASLGPGQLFARESQGLTPTDCGGPAGYTRGDRSDGQVHPCQWRFCAPLPSPSRLSRTPTDPTLTTSSTRTSPCTSKPRSILHPNGQSVDLDRHPFSPQVTLHVRFAHPFAYPHLCSSSLSRHRPRRLSCTWGTLFVAVVLSLLSPVCYKSDSSSARTSADSGR